MSDLRSWSGPPVQYDQIANGCGAQSSDFTLKGATFRHDIQLSKKHDQSPVRSAAPNAAADSTKNPRNCGTTLRILPNKRQNADPKTSHRMYLAEAKSIKKNKEYSSL